MRERRSARKTGFLVLTACMFWSGLTLTNTGCENYGAAAPSDVDTLTVALSDPWGDAQAHLFLYRITSLATGERLGVGRDFEIQDRRDVRAVVRLEGLDGNEPVLMHVMFISPTGKEMYTKEVFVKATDWPSAESRQAWADQFVYLDPVEGVFEMEARYGVGPDKYDLEAHQPEEKKDFRVGDWQVRIYLFRQLIMQTGFELILVGE